HVDHWVLSELVDEPTARRLHPCRRAPTLSTISPCVSAAGRVWLPASRIAAARRRKRGFVMPEAKQGRPELGRTGGPPEFAELLKRAEALVPVLRERAGTAEDLRRMPDE